MMTGTKRGLKAGQWMVVALLLSYATIGYGQVNENCVVSVLNRTIQVKSDGTWVLRTSPQTKVLCALGRPAWRTMLPETANPILLRFLSTARSMYENCSRLGYADSY